MKRIYIAGPYSADNVIQVLANIRQGIEMASFLVSEGYAVFCPFLDYQLAFTFCGSLLTKGHYQANSMAWVTVSDAILCLPGWEKSRGTLAEIKEADQHGIPVFMGVDDLMERAK